jgi:hypothetical protein
MMKRVRRLNSLEQQTTILSGNGNNKITCIPEKYRTIQPRKKKKVKYAERG